MEDNIHCGKLLKAHVKDTLCYVTIKVGDIYLKEEDHILNPFIHL